MGIRLGMTEAQVRAKLGAPSEVDRPRHEIIGRYKELRYGLTYISMFAGEDGQVFSITTTSKRERTARGAGVGSSERQVKRALRGERCRKEFGVHHCHLGRFEPGRTVTAFIFSKRGRVKRVTLGRVID